MQMDLTVNLRWQKKQLVNLKANNISDLIQRQEREKTEEK